MAVNKWIPPEVISKAPLIPEDQRIEFMVSNASQPIPEHKFATIYFYLYNQQFRPSLFGRYGSIMELIAAKPTLYRTVSNDGRAFIQSYKIESSTTNNNPSNTLNNNHPNPHWSITARNKQEIFGKTSVIFRIYKDGKVHHDIDLIESLFDNPNDSKHDKLSLSIGRDPNNDFSVQHVSISRLHAIFYFSNDGTIYLYDVSTHGTYINDEQCPNKKYVEIRHKDRIKFGHSSRIYLVLIGQSRNENNHRIVNTTKEEKKDDLLTENENQKNKINQMQEMIEKLTMELKNAKKDAANKGKQVISLMEQMECLHVTNSNRKKRENILRQFGGNRGKENKFENRNHRKLRRVNESESESEYDEGEESLIINESENEKRKTKINGIDFLKEKDNLGRLTVVKLRYYVDKNGINVGRVKKAELVKIIQKDLDKHYNL